MADSNRQNRDTLRKYFRTGSLPTEADFSALIDSTLNMVDEGFTRSPENGVEVSALGRAEALLSFCAHGDRSRPDASRVQWTIAYGAEDGGNGRPLTFVLPQKDAGERSVLALDPRRRVGIARTQPEYELDVNGVIRSAGRIGGYEPTGAAAGAAGSRKGVVPADGEWHDITGELNGCCAFEIMAGVGDSPGKGRYALLHAIALNAFNPRGRLTDLLWSRSRRRIRATEAYFSRRCDRLELRWAGTHGRGARYHLEIRSRCAYSKDVGIQCFLTQLWFDSQMNRSQPPG